VNTKANHKPIEVKRGNVTVKIYQGKNRFNGIDYPQFTLTYYEGTGNMYLTQTSRCTGIADCLDNKNARSFQQRNFGVCGLRLSICVKYIFPEKRFADLAEARREAESSAEKLSKGEGEVLHLTSVDRTIYVQALDNLRPLNVAVSEYLSAIKQLPQGATLKETVDFFRKRHPASLAKRTVLQVADEMIAARRAAKLSYQ
jgi:hypothetical protein